MTAPRPLGLAILGLGRHGLRYAQHLAAGEVAGARLVAVHRRDRGEGEAAARTLRCRFHATAEAAVADPEVEAVVVTAPNAAHAPLARLALAHGLPCLVEKPLGRSVEDALTIPTDGPLVAVAKPLRWNAVVREVRARLPEVGQIRGCWLAMRQEAVTADAWRLDPAIAGGGAALDFGTHLFDLLRWLLGTEVEAVHAVLARRPGELLESHCQALCTLATGPGEAPVLAQVECLSGTSARAGRIEVVGERGQLIADFRTGELAKLFGKARVPLEVPRQPQPLVSLLGAFVAAIRGDAATDLPRAEDGLAALRIVEACYRSAAAGRPVPVAGEVARC